MSTIDSQKKPEIFRFLHALLGTILMYGAVYGIECSFDAANRSAAFDGRTFMLFVSLIPLIWFATFLTGEPIRESLRGKFIRYAYYAMLVLTIGVSLGVFCLWGRTMLLLDAFSTATAVGWVLAFFLCTAVVYALTLFLVSMKVFPSFERCGL